MFAKIEARINITFVVMFGQKNDENIHTLQKVHVSNAAEKTATFKCVTRFKKRGGVVGS